MNGLAPDRGVRSCSPTGSADHDAIMTQRLNEAGVVPLAQTTASSEFGGINCTNTSLHGTTGNPWDPERTPGVRRVGRAAAVQAGSCPSPPAATVVGRSASLPGSPACSA